MTSANERWQEWMDKHWPRASDSTRRAQWDFWCRDMEAELAEEPEAG